MKYIDADKVRAEIERLENYYTSVEWYVEALLLILDTLEEETSYDTQKYTPSPSVDIVDVARVQFASHAKVFDKKRKAVFDWEQFKEVAGIFYGFGKKDTLSEEPDKDLEEAATEVYTYTFQGMDDLIGLFKAGAEWQREQKDPTLADIAEKYAEKLDISKGWFDGGEIDDLIKESFKAGAEWQKGQVLSLIESRISQIMGDAQPRPALRAELRDLIDLIKG